jgi:esterase/lipase superfamily enzyme
MQPALTIALAVALVACAPRGDLTFDATVARIGTQHEIFVGTSRAIDPETGEFGSAREQTDSYARYVVQVPPNRQPGEIRWPAQGRKPDPAQHFVTVERDVYSDPAAFRRDLAAALARLPPDKREVRVFAHGFNTTFGEGLYRLAQLDEDLGFPGLSVHYSWPSRGKPLAYFADRESAVYSRDGMESFLGQLVDAGAERIVIVGHSMGALLSVETLRQVAISGNRRVMDRIAGVVLIAPDIDVDVFKRAAARIGTLPQPFYIFTSKKDRALRLSSRLSGRPDRLGNVLTPAEVAELEVTLIDVTAFSEGSGHFNVGDSPGLIALLGRMADVEQAFDAPENPGAGLLGGTLMVFTSARSIIVERSPGRPGERN